jgi:hypothetical protein
LDLLSVEMYFEQNFLTVSSHYKNLETAHDSSYCLLVINPISANDPTFAEKLPMVSNPISPFLDFSSWNIIKHFLANVWKVLFEFGSIFLYKMRYNTFSWLLEHLQEVYVWVGCCDFVSFCKLDFRQSFTVVIDHQLVCSCCNNQKMFLHQLVVDSCTHFFKTWCKNTKFKSIRVSEVEIGNQIWVEFANG